ncbi:hypothetical protein HDV00_005532 [Rhizophlyctis rosea]|nr:hypothetical protein HDV00_005532 [Rhizophlyctis rosea]
MPSKRSTNKTTAEESDLTSTEGATDQSLSPAVDTKKTDGVVRGGGRKSKKEKAKAGVGCAKDPQSSSTLPKKRKTGWTEDDKVLARELVTQHGAKNWQKIADDFNAVMGKTADQIKLVQKPVISSIK